MGKFKTVMVGLILGAGGMYASLQYHLVRAEEGFLLMPRSPQQRMQDAYADIRDWNAATWMARPRLALAVTEEGRSDLISDGVSDSVINELRSTLGPSDEQLGEISQGWEPATTTSRPASVGNPPPAVSRSRPQNNGNASGTRRGFLPLAELFGLREAPNQNPQAQPRADNSGRTPVRPTGVTRPRQVELLPPPVEYEALQPPADVDLGPSVPIPGSTGRVDRRRSDASEGWQPLSGQSF